MLPPRFASVLVAAATIAACSPLRIGGDGNRTRELMLAGLPSEPAVEAPTSSFALDRITRRDALLSGTVRRTGTGRGVAIYVFDGGISPHPEFAGRLRAGFDVFPGQGVCNPHGTAVAGAAAGATLGVAPGAEIVDVKIINCALDRGTVEAITAAARWTVLDHRRHPGQAAVANWSFVVDSTRDVPAVDSAIEMLRAAGILVVASAGNIETDACHVSPANAHGALVVGASSLARRPGQQPRDVRTAETAFGRCVDLYAPGDSVLLPVVTNRGPSVATWTGTSMSAGYVSGAVSLLLERFPFAGPDVVARLLLRRATPNAVAERGRTDANGTMLYIGPI